MSEAPEGQPVMFRAGREDGQQPAPPSVIEAAASGPRVLLADISVWQPNIADAAYLKWSKAIIFRALYGTQVDRAWYGGGRRDALHAGGASFVGLYQYLTAGQPADVQAHGGRDGRNRHAHLEGVGSRDHPAIAHAPAAE